MAASTTSSSGSNQLPPSPPHFSKNVVGKSRAGGARFLRYAGVTLTLTRRNEVAWFTEGGAVRSLPSESFFDASRCTRVHFVDVQGRTEPIVLLVSVREDEGRMVCVRRLS